MKRNPIVLMKSRSLFVYGSFIHPENIRKVFSRTGKIIPVQLEGYERKCNHQAVNIQGKNGETAVFNIYEKDNSFINGVLIQGLSEVDEWIDYRKREIGYDIVKVPNSQLTLYSKDIEKHLEVENELTYTAKGERILENPQPIPWYIEMCVNGAEKWGQVFKKDFISTSVIPNYNNLNEL